ncbi:MAG: ion channel, partial [Actinomycetota bacterium]|nr:ion channel [Actinomycetota bacterium]
MQWWMIVVGTAVVVVTVFDAFATTLSPSTRAGPVTSRMNAVLWRLARRASRSNVAIPLVVAGPLLLVTTAMVWIGGLWLGWTLLFAADPNAVVSDPGGIPADLSGRVFYTGYTLFTLGLGNYVPQGAVWEVLSAVALINGLVLVTMSIT